MFKNQWNFFEDVIESSSDWSDKAFVLVPYGLEVANKPVAMITHADGIVQNFFAHRGVTRASFDTRRIHLFGYSNGAAMAFRMAHEFPDTFASIGAVCGADGGHTYASSALQINDPNPSGSDRISLTLYVGGADATIPPDANGVTGTTNFSETEQIELSNAGVPNPEDENYAVWVRTASDTIKDFLDYNKTVFGTFNDALGSPSSTVLNQTDINGGTTRQHPDLAAPGQQQPRGHADP